MPKSNPKHNKTRLTRNTTVRSSQSQGSNLIKCCVADCGKPKKRVVGLNRVNAHVSTLNWTIVKPKKSKKVALCKAHYQKFQKLENKEDKWKKMRDYGPSTPKLSKQQGFGDY